MKENYGPDPSPMEAHDSICKKPVSSQDPCEHHNVPVNVLLKALVHQLGKNMPASEHRSEAWMSKKKVNYVFSVVITDVLMVLGFVYKFSFMVGFMLFTIMMFFLTLGGMYFFLNGGGAGNRPCPSSLKVSVIF